MKKKKKEYGFTLIELLAVIAILALVFGLTGYIIMNVISGAREKSYQVTVNNVENVADNYLMENRDKLFYVSNEADENLEYQCVTIQDLIENGYFKTDVLDSSVSDSKKIENDDYVYIERNKDNKSITKVKYLVDGDVSMCDRAVKATSDVSIIVTPNEWSSYKEIMLIYKVKNYFNIEDYTYHYSYDKSNAASVVSDEGNVKKLKVIDNGVIKGWVEDKEGNILEISNSKEITGIDKIPPVIDANDIVRIYGSNFDLCDGLTITDNSGKDVICRSYIDGKEITDSSKLSFGDNVVYHEAEDLFGNVSKKVARIIKMVLPDKEFDYLEEDQIYPVEADGTYIIEAYGAQGGNSGGLGGYVKAEVELKTDEQLVINTGGINGYNGGGGYANSSYTPGGGATTVRLDGNYIVIAAGGGARGNSGSGGGGGNGNGSGGVDVGAGAGLSGSNGGGGSNSQNYTHQCNCKTSSYSCNCRHYSYQCKCSSTGVVIWQAWCSTCTSTVCGTCSTTSCETCTEQGKSGTGGSNSVNSKVLMTENISGKRENNGYVKISYKLED